MRTLTISTTIDLPDTMEGDARMIVDLIPARDAFSEALKALGHDGTIVMRQDLDIESPPASKARGRPRKTGAVAQPEAAL